LQIAFKAINNTVRLDRLVLTLLIYSAYPRITKHNPPSLLVAQQALAIKKAIVEVQKLQAKRQVNNAFNMQNGLNITRIHNLALNSDVLI
jgi:uncharacterized protein (UPF0333 family)